MGGATRSADVWSNDVGISVEDSNIGLSPSSLGKTTFAGQLAEAGDRVLYFALEQSKFELVSKGISHQTARKYGDSSECNGICTEAMK